MNKNKSLDLVGHSKSFGCRSEIPLLLISHPTLSKLDSSLLFNWGRSTSGQDSQNCLLILNVKLIYFAVIFLFIKATNLLLFQLTIPLLSFSDCVFSFFSQNFICDNILNSTGISPILSFYSKFRMVLFFWIR